MVQAVKAILDTSVVSPIDVAPLDGELAVSSIPLAGLDFGILVSKSTRGPRLKVATSSVLAAHPDSARLYTRNLGDFQALDTLIDVVADS